MSCKEWLGLVKCESPIKVKTKNKKIVTTMGEKSTSVFANETILIHSLKNLQGRTRIIYFPNETKKEYFIEGFFIHLLKSNVTSRDPINKKKLKPKYPKNIKIRVRYFSAKNQLPYQDITKENIIFEISTYKPQCLDVSAYNIMLPAEGIFIG